MKSVIPAAVMIALLAACNSRDQRPADFSLSSGGEEHVIEATVGRSHACAISSKGTAYCWGSPAPWLLGTDVDTVSLPAGVPVRVAGNLQFKSIAAGETFTCAIAADGQAYCWGKGDNGELGGGKLYDQARTPRVVAGDQRFTSIVAGRQHACALDTSGAAWCWGSNELDQVSDGSKLKYAQRPARVVGGHRFRLLGANGGANSTCGVTIDGNGVCWGSNAHGQLGIGSRRQSTEPVRVAALTNIRDIDAGHDVACAVGNDGGVYCWGSNRFGQLGIAAPEPSIPQPSGRVQTYERFVSVAAGAGKACALAATGQAYCWGSNADNLLNAQASDLCADKSTPCATKPERVPSSVFRQLSIGSTGQVCGAGRFESGPVICWGPTVTRTPPGAIAFTGAQTIHLWEPDLASYARPAADTVALQTGAESGALSVLGQMKRSPLDSVPEDARTTLHTLLPDFVAFYPEHFPEQVRNSYAWSPHDGMSVIRANLGGAGLTDFVLVGRDTKTQMIVALMRDTAANAWRIRTVSYGTAGPATLSPRATLQRGASMHPGGQLDAVLVHQFGDGSISAKVERFYWDLKDRRFYLDERQ